MKVKGQKLNQHISFVVTLAVLMIFTGCTAENENILITSGSYNFIYYEIISGDTINYLKEIEETSLTSFLNDWISDQLALQVSYGNTPEGDSILEDLYVKNSYLKKSTIIIVFNDSFLYFNNNHTQPKYFMSGLTAMLKQIPDVYEYSIEIAGYKSDIINPEGVSIKKIKLQEQ